MSDLDALRDKYFEILMEEAGKSLSAEERKSSATIVRTKADGTKDYKYPMPDKKHARLALSMIDRSDLSKAEKDKVRARAEKMLGHSSEKMEEGGSWDKPWTKEDESKMKDDEKKKMVESWSSMSDEDKKKMMEEYGSYGPKMKKKMMESWGSKDKKGYHRMPDGKMMKGEKHNMKEGYGKKKEPMKEANGMVGSKADPNPPTNKKMMETWEGGGDMGQTGDPKKKPMKTKGKSWLAKGDSEPSAS